VARQQAHAHLHGVRSPSSFKRLAEGLRRPRYNARSRELHAGRGPRSRAGQVGTSISSRCCNACLHRVRPCRPCPRGHRQPLNPKLVITALRDQFAESARLIGSSRRRRFGHDTELEANACRSRRHRPRRAGSCSDVWRMRRGGRGRHRHATASRHAALSRVLKESRLPESKAGVSASTSRTTATPWACRRRGGSMDEVVDFDIPCRHSPHP